MRLRTFAYALTSLLCINCNYSIAQVKSNETFQEELQSNLSRTVFCTNGVFCNSHVSTAMRETEEEVLFSIILTQDVIFESDIELSVDEDQGMLVCALSYHHKNEMKNFKHKHLNAGSLVIGLQNSIPQKSFFSSNKPKSKLKIDIMTIEFSAKGDKTSKLPTIQAGVYNMNDASIDLHEDPNFSVVELSEFGIEAREDWHGYFLSFKKKR